MDRPDFEVTRISDGLGFGHGEISGRDEPEVLERLDETVRTSPDLLAAVNTDAEGRVLEGDGCGDGRPANLIFRLQETLKHNLYRAKVFGGAGVMTAAAFIGAGKAKGKTLNELFDHAIDELNEKEIDFGAHIDEHAHGENCGCGAIDHAPEAIRAAVRYEEPICTVIRALGVDAEALDTVYDNYKSYAAELPGQPVFSGRKVMDRIINAGKVIKRLAGTHKERCIILNTVRGCTIDQKLIREATDDKAQAFAVDIWRLEDLALSTNPYAKQERPRAFLSELVYTLAIAGVLTKGDLPVYMVGGKDVSGGA